MPSRILLVYKSSFISLLFVFLGASEAQDVYGAYFILDEMKPGDFESLFYRLVHGMLN